MIHFNQLEHHLVESTTDIAEKMNWQDILKINFFYIYLSISFNNMSCILDEVLVG